MLSSIPKFRGKALDIAQEDDKTLGMPKPKKNFSLNMDIVE
jgi:hypothetical protein